MRERWSDACISLPGGTLLLFHAYRTRNTSIRARLHVWTADFNLAPDITEARPRQNVDACFCPLSFCAFVALPVRDRTMASSRVRKAGMLAVLIMVAWVGIQLHPGASIDRFSHRSRANMGPLPSPLADTPNSTLYDRTGAASHTGTLEYILINRGCCHTGRARVPFSRHSGADGYARFEKQRCAQVGHCRMKRVEWLVLAALPRYRPGDDAHGARRGRVHRLLRPVSVLAILRLMTLLQSNTPLPLTGALALASLCCIHRDIHFQNCAMWSAAIGATLAWERTASLTLTICAAAASAAWPSFPSNKCRRCDALGCNLTVK